MGEPHMSAFRFDCVFYYVSDLDRAIRFYTTVLGFELSSRDVVGSICNCYVARPNVASSTPRLIRSFRPPVRPVFSTACLLRQWVRPCGDRPAPGFRELDVVLVQRDA
jgi:hypothetical protein